MWPFPLTPLAIIAQLARGQVSGEAWFALESAGARMCREAGGRVATNVMVRDLDIAAPDPRDGRRLEIVVDGLPLFGSAQFAVDTTLVFPLHGTPTPEAANSDGAALVRARRRKDGLTRLAFLLGCLRVLERGTRPSSCVAEWSKHGGSRGGLCCLALLPELLQLSCWACVPVEVQMGCLRCPMRWYVTTALQGWVERACMRF